MKKLFISFLVFSIFTPAFASETPTLYSSTESENRICTMDYNPVCGINGKTYGNLCMAGDNEIAYNGECNSYVDNRYYKMIKNKYYTLLKNKLLNYNQEELSYIYSNIDKVIEAVKKSKISPEMQKKRITIYTFFKNIIPEVINYKSNSIKDVSYLVDGQEVTLNNGVSETKIENSSSKIITKYFGNITSGDFNNDGNEDTAFLITQDNGGSGTFYYVVVTLKTQNGYVGTNAIFLGDRIAPQSSNYIDGKIVINYATRNPDEAMTTAPSVGVSRYFEIVNNDLVEIK